MQLSPRLPWRFLLATVVAVPLAVGVIPVSGTPLTLNMFVSAKVIVLSVLLALALGSWAIASLGRDTLFLGRPLIPLGVFLAVAAVAAVTALSPRIAVFGDFEQGVGLLVVALCALGALLIVQQVRDVAHLTQLTSVVIFTATGVAVVGLLQQIAGFDVLGIAGGGLPEWILQRGYGTVGNADTYSAYLVLPALLAVDRLRSAATQRDRMVWGAAVIAILMSCVMAQTRAPLAGLIVGGAAYGLGELRRHRRQAPRKTKAGSGAPTSSRAILVMIATAIVIGVVATSTFGTALDLGERFGSLESLLSLGGRLPLWTSAVEITSEYPLLGVGPDSFRLGWYPVRDIEHLAGGVGLVITDPHSVPLLFAATMGVTGLLAGAYLIVSAIVTGFASLARADAEGRSSSDYGAWLCGTIALSVTLLATLLTSLLLFMMFAALGVLIAPALRRAEQISKATVTSLRTFSLAASAALLVFGLLGASAHLIAVGARTEDTVLNAERASRAATLAPWDAGLRNLRDESIIQAALEAAFTGRPDATTTVDRAIEDLAAAAAAEPHDYRHRYRVALLLIGSGQVLGADYTERGIEAGLEAMTLYPMSVELRTGVASGFLQLNEPGKAEVLLSDLWDADPNYLAGGLTYAEALLAQEEVEAARSVVETLNQRFPDSSAVAELQQRIQTD